jgi:hypothetical protein
MNILKLIRFLEETSYALATWMILLPKTLIRITLNPRFIIPYIHNELKEADPDRAFDEYLSPVSLWIFAVAVPNIYVIDIVDRVAKVISTIYPDIGSQINSLDGEGRIVAGLIFTLFFPVAYILWIDWVRSLESVEQYSRLSKPLIKAEIQIQCYVQSAAQIPAAISVMIIGRLYPASILLPYIPYIVLMLYEAYVIKIETGTNFYKSLAISALLLAVYFGIVFLVFPNK